ncbi:MAG TPA: sigma-54 dependent transcriptional regulator [Thermohalobaculum sp.]|nr:sigma-54 dependent transcriptional regulator [Thermohalobaculum sp.]
MNAPLAGPILIVEDTRSLSKLYQAILRRQGYRVSAAASVAEAGEVWEAERNRLLLLDLMLPDGDGIELLRRIARTDPAAKVIVVTADGSINRAVEAMREGAFDFLVKPFDDRRLMSAIGNAVASLAAEGRGSAAPPAPGPAVDEFEGLIGASPAMRRIYEMLRSIGRSTATVFITGESGTGKEMAAQAIHRQSGRARGPFVPLNCGAIPRDLLESEVFGHLRGSFTGAIADKPGAAALADGGTLFLDEICEMDLTLQTKLLRFLQTSMIHPVGAASAHKVDVRIVCATNRDPQAEVRAGRFREDLFYRLHVVPIELPPLRRRGEDVNLIAERLIRQYATEEGRRFRGLAPKARALFRAYDWPGNVRQLQNVLRNIVVLNDGDLLEPALLPPAIQGALPDTEAAAEPEPAGPPVAPAEEGATEPGAAVRALVGTPLSEVERALIEATIAACGGSIPRAARVLELSPSTIYRKREAWGVGR